MSSPLTVPRGASIRETIHELDRTAAHAVGVVNENGSLVGTVSDDQIRREITAGRGTEEPVSTLLKEVALEDEPVETAEVESTKPEPTHEQRTVLVIGGAGYIGSMLCRELLERGVTVRVLDSLLFGEAGVSDLIDHDRFSLKRGDMRSIGTLVDSIRGVDAVVHLGGIVGDPACEIDPQKTLEYNYHAAVLAASVCRYHQINRFVFASTCSVYGKSATPDQPLTETDSLNPVSLYAQTKIDVESALKELADDNFSPTICRLATVYGRSPRMRFDLVGNVLPAKAATEGTIPVFGGEQFRPNVHVADVARAFGTILEAPIDDVSGEVFNVGSDNQNYRILELAEQVSTAFPGATIDRQQSNTDERSYCVDFEKIRTTLGFEPAWTIDRHCQELQAAFDTGLFTEYTADSYHNYRWLENDPTLLVSQAAAADGQVDRSPLDSPASTGV